MLLSFDILSIVDETYRQLVAVTVTKACQRRGRMTVSDTRSSGQKVLFIRPEGSGNCSSCVTTTLTRFTEAYLVVEQSGGRR